MPLARKKDEGAAAPVLNILQARVRLYDVEEHTEPYTVTRKSDGASFELDPNFGCTVEVVGDGADGSDKGAKFFESFKYKKDSSGEWFNKSNSKLGQLTEAVKPGYFDDASIPDLREDDLEGFEMLCRVKPKKNPQTGQTVGSTVDWETMRPAPAKQGAEKAGSGDDGPGEVGEEDFDDIPW
jgi:hypothetical protein